MAVPQLQKSLWPKLKKTCGFGQLKFRMLTDSRDYDGLTFHFSFQNSIYLHRYRGIYLNEDPDVHPDGVVVVFL